MKKIILAVAVISAVTFIGCKSGASGDPKAILALFFDALSKKDLESARKYATADSKQMIDLMEMAIKSSSSNAEMDKYKNSQLEYGETKIEGDKATVKVTEKTSGEAVNYILKKEEGSWKVAFDKATMMSIGMDKMKEKGMNPMDSLQKGINELNKLNMDSMKRGMQEGLDQMKNIDMDSLKRAMQEGMKSLDTLNKEMKKMH